MPKPDVDVGFVSPRDSVLSTDATTDYDSDSESEHDRNGEGELSDAGDVVVAGEIFYPKPKSRKRPKIAKKMKKLGKKAKKLVASVSLTTFRYNIVWVLMIWDVYDLKYDVLLNELEKE